MSNTVIKTIFSTDRRRKLELYRRPDGTFGFEEWHFDLDDDAWVPFGRRSLAICDSPEKAEDEARRRVEWLSDGGADA